MEGQKPLGYWLLVLGVVLLVVLVRLVRQEYLAAKAKQAPEPKGQSETLNLSIWDDITALELGTTLATPECGDWIVPIKTEEEHRAMMESLAALKNTKIGQDFSKVFKGRA